MMFLQNKMLQLHGWNITCLEVGFEGYSEPKMQCKKLCMSGLLCTLSKFKKYVMVKLSVYDCLVNDE
jgi:hypothetical protein